MGPRWWKNKSELNEPVKYMQTSFFEFLVTILQVPSYKAKNRISPIADFIYVWSPFEIITYNNSENGDKDFCSLFQGYGCLKYMCMLMVFDFCELT